MSFKTTTIVLASAVADAGTVTVAYPSGTAQADYTGANAAADGVAVLNNNEVYTEAASQISLSYGASNITLTNDSGGTWAAGTEVLVQLGQSGGDSPAMAPAPAISEPSGGATVDAESRTAIGEILNALRSQGIIAE